MSRSLPFASLDFDALAQYGDRLVECLAKRLKAFEIPGCDRRNLYRYREFFQSCPQILVALSPKFAPLLGLVPLMARMATDASVPSSLKEQHPATEPPVALHFRAKGRTPC